MKPSSRRTFIKKKILGGLLFAAGAPFVSCSSVAQAAKSPLLSIAGDGEDVDWEAVREQFLLEKSRRYFNTGSLGPSTHLVVDKVCELMKHLEAIAHVGHGLTHATNEKFAKLLNASPEEIAVTRNTTEGMNIVARSLSLQAGDEVLITNHEHIGGAAPWVALQKDKGVVVKLVELDLDGNDNFQRIKDSITAKTKVVSFSHVTYSTGLLLPAKAIADLCREKGIYSVIDGAQAIGMIPIDVQVINPDFYVGSGHKWLFGPKGTGVLYMKQSVLGKCSPVFVGAYTDKKFDLNALTLEYRAVAEREEYGTRNTPIIVGLGTAIDFISTIGMGNVARRGRLLADHFRTGAKQLPQIEVLTPEDPKYSASIITIRIKNVASPEAAKRLRSDGSLRVREIFENDFNGLRISFSIFNSIEEVDYLLDALRKVIAE